MAVTGMASFEAQQTAADGVQFNGAAAAYNTTIKRTGAASARLNPGSGAAATITNTNLPTANYIHFGFYVATLPSIERRFQGTQSATTINCRIDSTGAISVYANNTLLGTSSPLSTGAWYWIGVRQVTGTDAVFLQIDGTDAVTGAGTVTVTGNSTQVGFGGTEASAVDVYFDDLIFDDAGFLQPSKVDTALPISDNTRTAVTGGAGGTTNLWDAVNNTPPTGVVSASETNTTNIEYPASTTEDYIANLETYATLGILPWDAVLAVQSIVQHGEDIATQTKNFQNMGALTNPTVGGASVVAGLDAGAHGATPTNWQTAFGTATASPSVALDTSPTIRTSRVSEARVACIDFMGMLVAWTPGAVPNQTHLKQYPQLLAH